jgi:hypothetical protein
VTDDDDDTRANGALADSLRELAADGDGVLAETVVATLRTAARRLTPTQPEWVPVPPNTLLAAARALRTAASRSDVEADADAWYEIADRLDRRLPADRPVTAAEREGGAADLDRTVTRLRDEAAERERYAADLEQIAADLRDP